MAENHELIWKKFNVLDDGFVCLVDYMGNDEAIVQAARVSYGEGTKSVSSSRDLIRYLMRHAHTTPIEQCELKFLVRCPMDVARQWHRHRTFSYNEMSTRYSVAIDSAQKTKATEWRLQSQDNKQGSSGCLKDWPDGWNIDDFGTVTNEKNEYVCETYEMNCSPGEYLSTIERDLHEAARDIYLTRLMLGVAREQARKDLPLSTYTEFYAKVNLHNLLHFLSLRMESHAQKEIRAYADIIGNEIVAKLFPITWEAFNDYHPRRNALLLTALDVEALSRYLSFLRTDPGACLLDIACKATGWPNPPAKCRERDEFIQKVKKLNLEV